MADPSIPAEVVAELRISQARFLAARDQAHWSARRGNREVVVRRCAPRPPGDFDYELRLLEELRAIGWPVAVALEPPVIMGRATWVIFDRLPGTPPATDTEADQVARGRLLATLHRDLAGLNRLGQRPGWREVREVVDDPALTEELAAFGQFFPVESEILLWHARRAQELFEQADYSQARRVVLHGDLAPWNLLFENGQLTGVMDFELAHLDVAVADFALSWRGRHDAVIRGYEEITPLTELDWALLTPAYWAWLFIGVVDDLHAMNAGHVAPALPEWTLTHLLRRSPLMGRESQPYSSASK